MRTARRCRMSQAIGAKDIAAEDARSGLLHHLLDERNRPIRSVDLGRAEALIFVHPASQTDSV
jgi:hypothetical protein